VTITQTEIDETEAAVRAIIALVNGGPTYQATMPDGTIVDSPAKIVADSGVYKFAQDWPPQVAVVDDPTQPYSYLGSVLAPKPSEVPFSGFGDFPTEKMEGVNVSTVDIAPVSVGANILWNDATKIIGTNEGYNFVAVLGGYTNQWWSLGGNNKNHSQFAGIVHIVGNPVAVQAKSTSIQYESLLVLEHHAGSFLTMLTDDDGESGIVFGTIDDNKEAGVYYTRDGGMQWRSAGDQVLMTLDASKSLGLGGITTIDPSAILEISSTTHGFRKPRLTSTERDAISNPEEGLEIYNLTTVQKEYHNGTSWVANP